MTRLQFLHDEERPPPIGVVECEVWGATITDIRRRATDLVTRFADGNPFELLVLGVRPRIVIGGREDQVSTWEADCRATIYPAPIQLNTDNLTAEEAEELAEKLAAAADRGAW